MQKTIENMRKKRGHQQQFFPTPNVGRPNRNTQTKKLQGPYYFYIYSILP
jgi:hypothetical protein